MKQTFVRLLLCSALLSGSISPALHAENLEPEGNIPVLLPVVAETETDKNMSRSDDNSLAMPSRLTLGGYGEAVMSLVMPARSGLEYPDTIVCL
ncbi:MAG: hypothetical protein VB024_09180 [Dysgonamonadaceae bacterium]|jgi:hypothetical protein|nr:hypothetical protein [Dysgonamonadaceae bacterium]